MKSNISDYPEFLNAIQHNELVYLFGAGISSALTDNRSLSWGRWIARGIDFCKDSACAAELKKSMGSDDSTENLIRVVGEVIKHTKAEGTYHTWMQESIETVTVSNHTLAATLQKLLIHQGIFATTNYDNLLEQATGLSALSYEEPEKAFSMLDKRKNDAVLHIHGIYDSAHGIDNIVADQAQYNAVLSDKGAQFIQQILGTRTLVFVGCGQTTEDGNISQFIQFAKKYLNMDVTYYFIHNSDITPVDMPDNIKMIPYGNEYSDLPLFLEDIAQERLKSIISKNKIVGFSVFNGNKTAIDSILQYHYTQERIAFCGREEELSQLQAFLNGDDAFSWWSITGQAGSGKSRLALELLHRIPAGWFGFFLDNKATSKDIETFTPFSDTIIIIDYVAGRESFVADCITRLNDLFSTTAYKLRILLIERENSRQTGSWYAKLLQRFGKYDSIARFEFKEKFLYIEDLDEKSVEKYISNICALHGLATDPDRDRELRSAYGRKFEKLKYRPLYVQLFVEAWINNGFSFPHYDTYEDILRYTLEREQEKWLNILEGDQECCNSFTRLLVRANISGSLNTNNIPDIYRKDWNRVESFISNHSFPGQQRNEVKTAILTSFCQNDESGATEIIPLFPDIIKEFMFYFYAEEDTLHEVMKEIWQNAASDFTVFITRCLSDFPDNDFYKTALNIYDDATKDYDVLAGRLNVLKRWEISEDDDPTVLYGIVRNEYEFWKAVTVPADGSEDADEIGILKVCGLNYAAKQLGGWTRYDVSDMMEAIEESLRVSGGDVIQIIKQFFLQDHIIELSKGGFPDAATHLRTELEKLLAESNADASWKSCLQLQSRNTEMMEHILDDDFPKAYAILCRMNGECNYADIESVKMFAHSCFSIDNFAALFNNSQYIGKGQQLVAKAGFLYPSDPAINARIIGGRVSVLQYQYLNKHITGEQLMTELNDLQERLSALKSDGDNNTSDAINMAWGLLLGLKINGAWKNQAELESLIGVADQLLDEHENYDCVASAKIQMVTVLHEKIRHDKVSHAEVEAAFKYVENNYNSNSLRRYFFEMLEKSEDAGSKENYMTKQVMCGARQGAAYDPLIGSGIPEVDYEEAIRRELYEETLRKPYQRTHKKIGANEPCPCGSGKKFKKCCRGNGMYD